MDYGRDENSLWDVSDGSPSHEHKRESVDMTTRKESIVMLEAADLYGDIHTAESEYMNRSMASLIS